MRCGLPLATAFGLLFLPEPLAAQAPAEMTPGDVAVLVRDRPSADTRQRVQAALKSDDPLVRATAARVAWAAGIAEIDKSILDSLAAETDAVPTTEKIRALLYLNGAGAVDVVRKYLPRAGFEGQLVFAEWLARMQPQRFADELAEIAAADQDPSALNPIVGVAVKQHPEHRDRVLRAWVRSARPSAWREFVGSRTLDPKTDAAIFIEALHSTADLARVATVWHLASLLADQREIPVEVFDAATRNALPSDDNWELFGRELLVRSKQNGKSADRADLIQSEGRRHLDLLRIVVAYPRASKTERQVAITVLGDQLSPPAPARPAPHDPPLNSVAMRVPWAPWRGFVRSLFRSTGCDVTADPQFAAARVSYRPSGVPERVGVDPNAPLPCQAAVALLARLSVASRDHEVTLPDNGSEWLVVPLEETTVDCIDSPVNAVPRAGIQPEGTSNIQVPKKTRDVRPVYPEGAITSRIQGTVVLDAIINSTGCVGGVQLTRGITPPLDFAAIKAVTGWRFTPTLLNGQPVPVVMTVTVTFKLE